MTTFRTEYIPVAAEFEINHSHRMMMLGSCFTENIGEQLQKRKFQIDMNPFGIIYNPKSIINSLNILLEAKPFTEADIFYHSEGWHSFYHHSRFSSPDKDYCIGQINSRIVASANELRHADFLFLTLGTACVYRHRESCKVVSNCHKVSAVHFSQEMLTAEDIVHDFTQMIQKLKHVNPKLKIIITVSPVRHLKDGFAGNQLSKAILLTATHTLCKQPDIHYFPAYEIMLDDLRDYRFYSSDMTHPNELAVNYIWSIFGKTYFSADTFQLLKTIEGINSARNHRPFNADTDSFRKFVADNLRKISQLESQYSYLNFDDEKMYFTKYQ